MVCFSNFLSHLEPAHKWFCFVVDKHITALLNYSVVLLQNTYLSIFVPPQI